MFTATTPAAAGQADRARELDVDVAAYRDALMLRRNLDADVTPEMAEEVLARRDLVGALDELERATDPRGRDEALDDVIGAEARVAYWASAVGELDR